MKKILVLAAASASLALVGCGGGSTGANADPQPKYTNSNPVVTASLQAPAGFMPIKGISYDGGYTEVSTYIQYDPQFVADDLIAKNFLLTEAGQVSSHVIPGKFMTVAAYEPSSEVLLADLLGISPTESTDGYEADLNAVSTALTFGILKMVLKDVEDGFEDEIAALSLSETLETASVYALQLDGYTLEDAQGATDGVQLAALEADLASEGTASDLQRLFNANLAKGVWEADNGSALVFSGDMVGYASAGTTDEATYTVDLNNGTFELSATFSNFGAQVIDLSSVINGGNTLTLMGQTSTR